MRIKSQLFKAGIAALLLAGVVSKSNAVTYSVDPGATWNGFMNVFEIPQNGGGYVFGSTWGTPDLRATFTGPTLSLQANTIGDPNPFWYSPSGGPGAVGNKTMDANLYQQFDGSLAGTTVNFTGQVLANTLVGAVNQLGNGWTAVAFIKDFASDFSSSVSTTIPLSPGVFNISLATINDPSRHVQFGFEVIGPDVWAGDPLSFNSVLVTAVPEPSSLALAGMTGVAALLGIRRRSK